MIDQLRTNWRAKIDGLRYLGMRHFCLKRLGLSRLPFHAAAIALATLSVGAAAAIAQQPDSAASLQQREADVTYDEYRLRSGETIDHLRIHYATLGSPHRNDRGEIDNAVMLLHWTGSSGATLLNADYKKAVFADGKPLDARRYFLIFPDNFGHGRSTKPSDRLRAQFPHYGYNDIVDLQHKLVTETLGINRLHAIVGMSMGGMNAWQWAEAYPDQVEAIMPVVTLPAPIAGRNLLWRRMAIADIRNDQAWQQGNYAKAPPGYIQAYQLLRMMIEGVPHLEATIRDAQQAQDYLDAQAKRIENADPNDLLYSLEASQDYDPQPGLAGIKAKVYALNFDDDEFNPDRLQILQANIGKVKNARFAIQVGSPTSFGHLTMAYPSLWSDHVGEFMAWINAKPTATEQ